MIDNCEDIKGKQQCDGTGSHQCGGCLKHGWQNLDDKKDMEAYTRPRWMSLWTPAYTPGDGQTSRVYSNNPLLHLYRSCYVTVKKPVLSYLLMSLLPNLSP